MKAYIAFDSLSGPESARWEGEISFLPDVGSEICLGESDGLAGEGTES